MTNLGWLLCGDPTVIHLTKKYLLDIPSSSNDEGLITKYLNLYNRETFQWGNGYYGPKWISTHYTLLELKYMEIMPNNPIYQQSLLKYVDYWQALIQKRGIKDMDLCITGMMVNLMAYGKIIDQRLDEMIAYILDFGMADGGWNCTWNRCPKPKISSVHTTINVLEGLSEYILNGYSYRREEVKTAITNGINVLLARNLYFVKGTNRPIHSSMTEHHYPQRWKYDYLRILEFLAKEKVPFIIEMAPALDLLVSRLVKGKLTRGPRLSGLIHFPIEQERFGRFNTLRAYIVLKWYKPELYHELMNQTFI
ncbi:MAG: hypothetical protein PHY83_06295 [Bacilli bacterium]|nr:hypothetical protein [Bacilli bacterium]